jgi:GTP-binding protein HflX
MQRVIKEEDPIIEKKEVNKLHDLTYKTEKAIAVAVVRKGADRELIFDYLDELEELANTAGAEIIEKTYQELAKPSSSTALGSGKVEEMKAVIEENAIDLVIFDDDLTPAQNKNLENAWKVKVIDRSGLILDIFARHAQTLEAKTQVELAQLQYLLPRLTRMWTHLSKQFGGIGTKGPGETQIETDRRLIKTRIQRLKEDLIEISNQKEQQRKNRIDLPKFALVGYTNAGKSTLMNALTDSGVYVENKLFATLDTTIRAVEMPGGQKAVISDTVGFIRKLPHHLVASFRSTLAEAMDADIIVHVVDVSHKMYKDQIKVVMETLASLKIGEKPTILALNKIDKIEDFELLHSIRDEFPDSILISAKKTHNISNLLQLMQDKYDENTKSATLLLPYADMGHIANIYSLCEIREREDGDEGIKLNVKINKDKDSIFMHKYSKYIVK